MKNVSILLILIGLFFACKKDKLKDQYAFLIGKWNWTHSTHEYGWCDNLGLEETISPDSEGDNYYMIFHKKGVVEFFQNNDRLHKYRVVFFHFEVDMTGQFYFLIDLDNDENNRIGAITNEYSGGFSIFPFQGNPDCESYTNYFTKE